MALKILSPAFSDGGEVPRRFTADGADVSPPLSWSGVPDAARELVLLMDDPDAPGRAPWVHWVLYKLAPRTCGLPEAVPEGAVSTVVPGAFQGRNGWGRLGYGGPAPPAGHGTHHYRFRLYALDMTLDVFHSLTRDAVWKAMTGHILEQAEWVGTYSR